MAEGVGNDEKVSKMSEKVSMDDRLTCWNGL
jgi:hypothetical protein